ncbi:MAG: glycosyltransferase family 4 protein [Bacteroidales bacterium]
MKKNIIICTALPVWSLGKNSGGRALYSTISGYINSGWSISLLTSGGCIPDEFKDKIAVIERRKINLSFLRNKFRVINWLLKVINYRLNCVFYKKNCEELLRSCNYETILYAYEIESVRVLKKLSVKHNLKLVTRFQGTIIEPLRCNNIIYKIRKYQIINALKTTSDLVIMTNDGTQGLSKLKELGNSSKHIEFWRNGVSVINKIELNKREEYRKKHNVDSTDFVFITVSRLESWKRVEQAVIAFGEVYKLNNSIKLIIIGDGDSKESLIDLANTLNLLDAIDFKGKIEQQYIYEYLIMADVFLSFYDISNLGNPLFEAMMCGKPIITLDVGDTKTVIKDNETGILISLDKMEIIPSKMKLLIDNQKLRYDIGLKAKNYADTEFYSWEERMNKEIRKVEDLFNE